MIITKRASYVIGSVLLASSLSACGSDDGAGGDSKVNADTDAFMKQSADEIVKASIADMETLTSVKVSAELASDGKTISLDLQLSTDGNCIGSVGLDGATADVLTVDGTSWFRPDPEFFAQVLPPEQAAEVAEAVDGKYLPDDNDQFSSFCDLDELLSNITDFDSEDEVSKGEQDEVDGEAAIIIEGTTDEGDPSKAFIATGEKHYILKFTADGADSGEVLFSKFNEDVEVTAPADDEIVDLNSLG